MLVTKKTFYWRITEFNAVRYGPHSEQKQKIASAWQQLSQAFVDKSINEWRRRLECVVQQNGGHIEHLFK